MTFKVGDRVTSVKSFRNPVKIEIGKHYIVKEVYPDKSAPPHIRIRKGGYWIPAQYFVLYMIGICKKCRYECKTFRKKKCNFMEKI